ncbi:MAG: RidA family protein [Calditrichaeota bacterium]|nr:MAG: RidA family protein [Calditrichota bacterium]
MKNVIKTDNAPQAIGPYSQAIKVKCGEMVYVSGNIPLNPKTMELVGLTAAEQCKQVMSNLKGVLAAAGAGFENVVKTTIYLKDMNDFASVNEIYASNFSDDPPARATVEVSRLPMDVLVEIDAIAVL